jgi:hypothetical protein
VVELGKGQEPEQQQQGLLGQLQQASPSSIREGITGGERSSASNAQPSIRFISAYPIVID